VITGVIGICHLFVDKTADQEKSIRVIQMQKSSGRLSAMPSKQYWWINRLLLDFIPKVCSVLSLSGVRFKSDQTAYEILNETKKSKSNV
jgi:glutamate-5-semialdehyde dehydrogenase